MDDVTPQDEVDTSRRAVVGGLVGLGLATPLLAACGGGSGGSSGSGGGSGGGASGTIGTTSEVPVGGAKIFTAEKALVSQPTKGDFRAFSTVCTHRQCVITKLVGDEIECGCHFSRFRVDDGSVANGPATKPLQKLTVTVEGKDLVLG